MKTAALLAMLLLLAALSYSQGNGSQGNDSNYTQPQNGSQGNITPPQPDNGTIANQTPQSNYSQTENATQGNETQPLAENNTLANQTQSNATLQNRTENATLEEQAFFYLPPTEQGTPPAYSIVNFTHNNSTAQALVFAGSPYAIFYPSESGVIEPITGLPELESALEDYYLSQGFSPNATDAFSQLHGRILAIENKRKPAEADCRRLMGSDTHECASYDSCQRACYSVTSFCTQFAFGIGKAFINEMWKFENNTHRLDRAYDAESLSFSQFGLNSTSESALAYVNSIKEINRAATAAGGSPLYTGYSFCFSPDYDFRNITQISTLVQLAYGNASHFYSLPETAFAVQNTTLAGLERKRIYELEQASFANSSNATNATATPENVTGNQTQANQTAPQNATPQNLSQNATSPPPISNREYVSEAAVSFIAAFLLLLIAAGGVYYLILAQKKSKKAETGQEKGPEQVREKFGKLLAPYAKKRSKKSTPMQGTKKY